MKTITAEPGETIDDEPGLSERAGGVPRMTDEKRELPHCEICGTTTVRSVRVSRLIIERNTELGWARCELDEANLCGKCHRRIVDRVWTNEPNTPFDALAGGQ